MKKNILYIIFFMVLVACKREAVFELEGYSGQILRDRTVGLRYPTAPGRQYFLSTQADSGDYFFLTGEITPGKVTFLEFGYQHLPLYVEKQHYRVVKENDNYYELTMNLPGVKKEDVTAELKDGYLTIHATSNQNKDEKDEDGKYIRRERYSGSCNRSFYVGDAITEEDIKANFENGTLKMTIPKKEAKAVPEKKFISIEG